MKRKEDNGIVTVPHRERPASLEVEITGIPKWKQDVFNLVAELTKYRLRNKITQKELADRLHVKQSVIARFEKLGRFPTIEFLSKVADGLGMEFDMSLKAQDKLTAILETKSECTDTDQYYQMQSSIGSDTLSVQCVKFQKANITVWNKYTVPGIIDFADTEKVLTGFMVKHYLDNCIKVESYSHVQDTLIKHYMSEACNIESDDAIKDTESMDIERDLAA